MNRFRTLEVSDPAYAPENTKFVTVQSPALGRRGDIVIYNPAPSRPDTPIIILLHGVYGSAWSWMYAGGVHQVYDRMRAENRINEFVLVMPSDGLVDDGSGYLNRVDGNYENWIVEDVLDVVLSISNNASAASRVYVCGLSMGGYGAIRLAFSHAGIFSGVSAHSPIVFGKDFGLFTDRSPFEQATEGSEDEDLIDLIETSRGSHVPFRFDCGRKDPLFVSNTKFDDLLRDAGIEAVFEASEGRHDWACWTENITRSFEFFSELERSQSVL